jgi:hypothetical protein
LKGKTDFDIQLFETEITGSSTDGRDQSRSVVWNDKKEKQIINIIGFQIWILECGMDQQGKVLSNISVLGTDFTEATTGREPVYYS